MDEALCINRGKMTQRIPLEEAVGVVKQACYWDRTSDLVLNFGRTPVSLNKDDYFGLHEFYVHKMPSAKFELGLFGLDFPKSVFGLFREQLEVKPQTEYITFGEGFSNSGDILSSLERSDGDIRRLLLTSLGESYRYCDVTGFTIDGTLISKYLGFNHRGGIEVSFVEQLDDNIQQRCFFLVQNDAWNPLR